MSAGFFQEVYPFLPFTHAIAALHGCVGGFFGNDYWVSLGKSSRCSCLVGSALGLGLRNPVIRLNRYVMDKLEETKVM